MSDIHIMMAVLSAISGILLGWIAHARQKQNEERQAGYKDGELKTDMQYVKRSLDSIRSDIKEQERRLDDFSGRLIRVESKQACAKDTEKKEE